MLSFIELQTMITLIENEYLSEFRNTPSKMIYLIKKEFKEDVSEEDILNFYNLGEDYERISNQIENGYNF